MTFRKTLLSAMGLAVALAFSAPVLTASTANAAGTTTSTNSTAPTKKKHSTHHKKSHQKTSHKKNGSM